MDLREIQALHAQYNAQPVIIDIASHTAAMPALPAPERGPTGRARATALASQVRKAGRPAFIALAIAAVAAGGGMSVARIWHAMHEKVAAPTVVAASGTPGPRAVAASDASAGNGRSGDMPIDAAPARPLTSNDFDSGKAVVHSALSNVDPRALSATASTPTADRSAQTARPAMDSAAVASPIRIQRPATPPAPTAAATPAPPPQPAAKAETQARTQPSTVATSQTPAPSAETKPAATAATSTQEQARPETRSALRPLHPITRHPAPTPGSDTSSEPVTSAQPRTQPPKSGDVQLF